MGLWPSEGSVSDEALSLAAEAGFEWAASDNGVLARTMHQDGGPEVTYRSYLWQQQGRELRMIFRDHFLSDLVGFVYSGMGAEEAAGAFSGSHSREHAADAGARRGRAGSHHSGWRERLGILRSQRPAVPARAVPAHRANRPDLAALTVSEALQLDPPRTLDHILPGSWINANFDVWIGAEEDNIAWEYLLRARRKFDEVAAGVSEEQRSLGLRRTADRRRQRLVLVVWARAYFRESHRVR